MNPLIVYMLKTAFYLVAFYVVYALFLSRDTLYGRNRVFILVSLILSIILPLITLQTARPVNIPFFGKVFSEVFVTANQTAQGAGNYVQSAGTGWHQIVRIVYLAGVILFSLKLVFDLLELVFLILRHKKDYNNIVTFSGLNTAGFSAMGHVFINSRLSPEEAKEIIRHETNHIERHHFTDIIFIELIKILQWFNPVIYMFNRSMRAVHEYQADECCIRSGITVINYQRILLNQLFRSNLFTLTNSFSNPTLIKKRMIMMTKKRSGSLANLKLIAILPLVAAVMLAFSTCSESREPVGNITEDVAPPPPPPPVPAQATEPYVVVEEMPTFPGGELELLKYLSENTLYPESAKEKGVTGRVILRFAVETDGKVGRTSVLKGVDPDLDAEALRVVSTL
ncbi:MAG TPA: M56 family metallopeptidase, partial [Bacteroidales bacterium]|nr:M56 family metallopeptidase [Bacteroidales bacterium]